MHYANCTCIFVRVLFIKRNCIYILWRYILHKNSAGKLGLVRTDRRFRSFLPVLRVTSSSQLVEIEEKISPKYV